MSNDAPLSPLKQALLALQTSQNRVAELEGAHDEPVAIIGMACRLPGSVDGPEEYWSLLRETRTTAQPHNLERWQQCAARLEVTAEQDGIAWGSLLDRVDEFDPAFFGISPREALSMDPQQRLLLEVSWLALENAAISPDSTFGTKTGVYFGLAANDYAQLQLGALRQSDMEPHFASGAGHSVASGRLSYILGWHGPSVSIDTACSSSLVAVQLASSALQHGDCSMALAGGVNLILSAESSIAFSRAGMLSSSGRVLSFGRGDGFVRGEGCGVVVLKRLRAAVAAGDRVLGVIRGSAVNHDGPGSGLTVPNGRAQAMLLRSALQSAGLEPSAVGYVEAHGTGTRLGDPIEAEALGEVFAGPREAPLRIGSVKTNLGHLEAAAGIAGLIKLVLALEHREIPAQLPVGPLSEHVRWSELPLEVATHAQPWAPIAGRRIGGVSAFGFSGTNAHVLVEEAPPLKPLQPGGYEHPGEVLALSAKSEGALERMIERYATHVESHPEQRWADLCHTAGAGRSHFRYRRAVAAQTADEGLQLLRALQTSAPASPSERPRIGFLFGKKAAPLDATPARELYAGSSVFREVIDRCEQALQGHLEAPLGTVMRHEDQRVARLLHQPTYASAAEFVLGCGLAAMWRDWGAEPAAFLGHGAGGWAAAVAREALPLEQAALLAITSSTPPLHEELLPQATLWIEMGLPSTSLETPGNVPCIASLRPGTGAWPALAQALAEAYTAGLDVDWTAWNRDRVRRRIALPGYAFERQRHWFTPSLVPPAASSMASSSVATQDPEDHPLLGRKLRLAGPGTCYEKLLQLQTGTPQTAGTNTDTYSNPDLLWLLEHRIEGKALMPAAAFIEILLAAGDRMSGAGEHDLPLELEEVLFSAPMPLDRPRLMQVVVDPASDTSARVRIYSTPASEPASAPAWTLHAEGTVLRRASAHVSAAQPPPPSLEQLLSRCADNPGFESLGFENPGFESIDPATFYARLNTRGAHFGPYFRGILRLWQGQGEALAEIRVQRLGQRLHPATLDACLQTAAATLPPADNAALLPFLLNSLHLHSPLSPHDHTCFVHTTLLPSNPQQPTLQFNIITNTQTQKTIATVKLTFKTKVSDVAGMFYRLRWHQAPSDRSKHPGVLKWLILSSKNSHSDELDHSLASQLRAVGQVCTTVRLDQFEEGELNTLLADTSGGVVYLHSPAGSRSDSAIDLTSQVTPIEELLDIARTLKRQGASAPKLYVLTHNAFSVLSHLEAIDPFEAIISGLAATIPTEPPYLRCIRIDLAGHVETPSALLVDEFLTSSNEGCVAYRNGLRYVQRIERFEPREKTPARLAYSASTGLAGLKYEPRERLEPGPMELEIKVYAAALNFHDVLAAMGVLPGDDPLGIECSGVVTRIGSGVSDYKVGDEVIAITSATFADYTLAQQSLTVSKSAGLSFAAAASLPIAYLTADHCLNGIARLRAGQTILIHAATGGVGLAAIHLCKRAGVRIFATAGSEHKRRYLRSLGIEHIMDSRTLHFRDEILIYTNGRGVDAVLNSLAGDFTDAGLAITAPSGYFLDIGATDIRHAEEVATLYPGVTYHSIDLALSLREHPERVSDRLSTILADVESGQLPVLPTETFSFTHTFDAFQHMAAAKHIGKVVLVADASYRNGGNELIRSDHTYIVTGGFRGLGFEVVKWLHRKGASRIVTVARHPPTPEVAQLLARLEENGTQIHAILGDVSDAAVVANAIETAGPKLCGIIHCAGVLEGAPLERQTWEHFDRVLKPKAEGAWLLHSLTKTIKLDFFVLFSSWASIAGAPGAANYCAANFFLDALAYHRRSIGLPATSINWGAWAEIGMAADNTKSVHGFKPLATETGIRALELALTHSSEAQLAIADVDWPQAFSFLAGGGIPSVYAGLRLSPQTPASAIPATVHDIKETSLLQSLESLPQQDRRRLLSEAITDMVSKVLSLPASQKVNFDQPLDELGLDSILAVELKTEISRRTEIPLPAGLLFDYPTLASLTGHIMGLLLDSTPPQPLHQSAPDAPQSPSILDRIEELSDDEVDRLIQQKHQQRAGV